MIRKSLLHSDPSGRSHKNYRDDPDYTPNRLVNKVMEKMGFKADSELADALKRNRSHVCALRAKRENLSAGWLLDLHDLTGESIQTLREWAGIRIVIQTEEG